MKEKFSDFESVGFISRAGEFEFTVKDYELKDSKAGSPMAVFNVENKVEGSTTLYFPLSTKARWNYNNFIKACRPTELDTEEKRRIRNTTIHAIIFEQKYPRNDTGMFQIFERINTGGRTLKAQEIRNCVYQGKCNDLLFELNKHNSWRTILGLDVEDSRMADLELILRYFTY